MRFPLRLAWLAPGCWSRPRRRRWPRPRRRRSGLRPAGRPVDAPTRPHRDSDRSGQPAAGRDRCPARAGRRRARRRRAAANLARNDLADTKRLLAPLEVKPASDAVARDRRGQGRPRTADRAGHVSEGRVKQCEVVIARADQLIERLTKLRGEVMLRTLLRRDASPLSRDVWSKLGPEFALAADAVGGVRGLGARRA